MCHDGLRRHCLHWLAAATAPDHAELDYRLCLSELPRVNIHIAPGTFVLYFVSITAYRLPNALVWSGLAQIGSATGC